MNLYMYVFITFQHRQMLLLNNNLLELKALTKYFNEITATYNKKVKSIKYLMVKIIKQYLTTAQLYDKKIPAMMKVQKLLKYFWEVCK